LDEAVDLSYDRLLMNEVDVLVLIVGKGTAIPAMYCNKVLRLTTRLITQKAHYQAL
jgi:hypothetical protein